MIVEHPFIGGCYIHLHTPKYNLSTNMHKILYIKTQLQLASTNFATVSSK